MRLITHYRNLLTMAGLNADDDGMVRRNGKKDEKPKNLFIQGKPVVLPIHAQLASADIAQRMVFHPFAESSSKGESVIVAELRSRFCANLSFALMCFMKQCVVAGASKAEHHKFNPVQAEMLDCVRKIDEKMTVSILSFFTKLLGMPEKKNVAMIQIYLSRNGTVGKEDYARAGIVSFPLYTAICEELEKSKDRSIEGIKMSEKELQYLKNLYEYVFPELTKNPHAYNRGSNSDVAPYMDALMRTTAAVEGMINERIRLFEPIFKDELVVLPEDWMDAIDELPGLISEIIQIPLQPGTDGAPRVADTIAQNNQMNMSSAPAQPTVIAPVTQAVQASQPVIVQHPQAPVHHQLPPNVPAGSVVYVVQGGGMPYQGMAANTMGYPAAPQMAQSSLNPYAQQSTAPVGGIPNNKPLWG